jgi:hypothetical protein
VHHNSSHSQAPLVGLPHQTHSLPLCCRMQIAIDVFD